MISPHLLVDWWERVGQMELRARDLVGRRVDEVEGTVLTICIETMDDTRLGRFSLASTGEVGIVVVHPQQPGAGDARDDAYKVMEHLHKDGDLDRFGEIWLYMLDHPAHIPDTLGGDGDHPPPGLITCRNFRCTCIYQPIADGTDALRLVSWNRSCPIHLGSSKARDVVFP